MNFRNKKITLFLLTLITVNTQCEGFFYNDSEDTKTYTLKHEYPIRSKKEIFYDRLCASAGDAIPTFLVLTASSIISFYIAKKFFHPNTLPSQKSLNSNSIEDTFDSIIGNDEAKENFQEIISFLKNPDIFKTIGLKTPKGILLHGKPGNGKTMLARAVAKESGCSFIAVSGPELEDKYIGQSAANIKALFQKARKNQPCIIFIDEIDSIGRKRDGRQYPDALLQLLAEMDGFAQSDNIVVIGATNSPESLDPALLRAGRFDRKIEIKDPDLQSRILLLKTLFSKTKFTIVITDEEFNEWGLKTDGFCNVDIAHIANEAGLKALQNKQNYKDKQLTISITYNDLMNITNKEIESKQNIRDKEIESQQKKRISRFQKSLDSNSIEDTFDSIIGNDEAKENFQEIISFLKNPDIFKTIGLKTPKGILLHGKPGNGKTMLARAVAKESGCSFIAVSGPELEDKYIGRSAANIKALFKSARINQPCIIFIDEIDSIGRNRDGRKYPDALLQLLAEMDGFAQSDNIVVIGATNSPESLDPALLRAGRFDRKIEIKDPDLQSRILLLKTLFSKTKFTIAITDEEFNEWGLKTDGFCNADIAHIANEAGLKALQNKQNYKDKQLTISITYNDLMNITNKEIESKQKINNPTVNTFDLSSVLNQIFNQA